MVNKKGQGAAGAPRRSAPPSLPAASPRSDEPRTPPPRSRGRPPSLARRRQILDVAAAMFAREGYHGTTMRVLAERAGVNPASLYHYFGSKEDALLEVCVTGIRDSASRMEAILASPTNMATRIKALIAQNVDDLEDHAAYRQTYYQQRDHLSSEQRAVIDSEARRVRRLLEQLFSEALARGELHPSLDVRQASLATAAVLQSVTRYSIGAGRRDFRHMAEGLAGTLIRGLCATER